MFENNELVTAEVATYGYDANGNTTTKTDNGQTTLFDYNATDRLTSVQLPDGRTATYTYDPFGRRIKKQVGTDVTIYVYADEGLIGEYTQAGTAKKSYGWRPGVNRRAIMTTFRLNRRPKLTHLSTLLYTLWIL